MQPISNSAARTRLVGAGVVLAAGLLAGCTVGPNYHPPRVQVPARFAAATQPGASTQPVGAGVVDAPAHLAAWWTTLHDPMLNRLIDRAIESNLDLQLAAARLRESRAREAIASGQRFPEIDAKAAYSHQRISGNSQPFASVQPGFFPFEWNLYQLGFDANWELDVFGGSRRGLEAAQADVGAGIESQRDVLLSMLAEVARDYVELRGTQRELTVAQANLKLQQQTLELTRNQLQQGVVSELDVARAAAEAAATESMIPSLVARQWQMIHRIALLLGQQPDALAQELLTPEPIPLPQGQVPVGLPSDLLRRRPDIRQAERQLAGATARIGVAVADLFPRFALVGGLGVESSKTSNLFDWSSRTFNFGPSFRWPIFDAGRLRAVVQVRNAQQEQALILYQRTVLRALSEVEDAIVSLTTEQQRSAALDERVKQTSEAAQIASDQYRQGLSDFLTVLDAQRSLLQAQDEQARSQAAVTTDLIALYKALGGGWDLGHGASNPDQTGAGHRAGAAVAPLSMEHANQ